jgi:hypothetical protein
MLYFISIHLRCYVTQMFLLSNIINFYLPLELFPYLMGIFLPRAWLQKDTSLSQVGLTII